MYLSDCGYAPYGERDATHVLARSRAITNFLLEQHQIKALVIACNTATALAIQQLRKDRPNLPIVGVEPALKPAGLRSATKHIGVLATRATLQSAKFQMLLGSTQACATFICQACDGLADAIEQDNAIKIRALCAEYMCAFGHFGSDPAAVDTVVLGCTHYPFVADLLQALAGPQVTLIESGKPVAMQTRRVLAGRLQLGSAQPGSIRWVTSGNADTLSIAALRWLGLVIAKVTLMRPAGPR